MRNKIRLKQYFVATLITSICLLFLFLIINIYEYQKYTANFNSKVSNIISLVREKYPDIDEHEIIKILNNDNNSSNDFFYKYGIDIEKSSIILENEKYFYLFLIGNTLFLVSSILALIIIFMI